jgi:hypothetical protein
VSFDFTGSSGGHDHVPEMEGALEGSGRLSAVSELMRAMILRAIEDLNGPPEVRDEAMTYLTREDNEEYVLSFVSICRYFGFDPAKTREAILKPKAKIRTRRRAA